MEGNAVPQEAEELCPEYAEILRRVAESPRKFPIPRSVSRKQLAQAFLTSFELIGGVPRLAVWADQNPDKFYALLSKLFPQQMEGTIKHEQSLAVILMEMGRAPALLPAHPAEKQVEGEVLPPQAEEETLNVHARVKEQV